MDINPSELAPANYTYARKAVGAVWLAGQLPLDANGEVVGTDPGTQAEQCLDNIEVVLRAAGVTMADVVIVRTYVTHWAHRPAVKEAIQRRFGDKRPPSTTLVVVSLGRPECLVEIEVVAAAETT